MRRILFISAILLVFVRCEKKRYPENISTGSPAFQFSGDVNGKPVDISAGINGYYLYSSYEIDPPVSAFLAQFSVPGCNNCGPALTIKIFNTDTVLSGESILKQASLAAGRRPFHNANAVSATFLSSFNRAATSYSWDFGDGTGSSLESPNHTFAAPGTYNVCLKTTDPNGCTSQVCNMFDLTPGGLRTQVTAQNIGSKTILFSNITSGAPPYQFHWNFGDGSPTSTEFSPLHTYQHQGSYAIVLTVTDNKGRTAVSHFNAVTQDDQSSCATNISVNNFNADNPSPLGGISVSWKDESGREYTSDLAVPRAEDFFEIVKVEDYEPNENGAPTKRITIRMNCSLSDGTSTLHIDNAEAVIAVSYN